MSFRERGAFVGWALWTAAYAIMAWRMVVLRTVVWPYRVASYGLAWEIVDVVWPSVMLRVNATRDESRQKRFRHAVFAVLDAVIVFGSATYDVVDGRRPTALLETFVAIVVYAHLARVLGRRFKYFCYAWVLVNHVLMSHLVAYAIDDWLRLAAWLQIVGNVAYIPKAMDAPSLASRAFFAVSAVALPLVGVLTTPLPSFVSSTSATTTTTAVTTTGRDELPYVALLVVGLVVFVHDVSRADERVAIAAVLAFTVFAAALDDGHVPHLLPSVISA